MAGTSFIRSRGRARKLAIPLLAAAFIAPLLLPSPARAQEPIERTGEILLTASEAWAEPGFRLQLRVGLEALTPLEDGPTDQGGLSLSAEPGFRLSRLWSVGASLRYTSLTGRVEGLRWTTTVDLGFHPVGGLFVAAGAGYAGLMTGSESCSFSGWAALGRLGYLIPIGQLFATGPIVQADLQSVSCGVRDFQPEPLPAGEAPMGPIFVRRDHHLTVRHRTIHFAWSFAWR